MNQQAVILTGYSKEELLRSYQQGNISTRLIELWPAEKIITAWLAGEQDFEFEMRHKNGSMFFIKVSAAIVFVAGKECIMAFARDITARKSEEQLLRQSESKYRHLFENNPVAIFIWDMSTLKVTEANKSAVSMFGYNKKEFENLDINSLFAGENKIRNNSLINFKQFEHDSNPKAISCPLLTKSGETIYAEITSHQIYYSGNPSILSMVIDVTEKVVLERKLHEERMRNQHKTTDAVISAEERERQGIGRELHDNVNQLLATARLYISMAKNSSNSQFHESVREADKLVEMAINEIRNLSHSMISPLLEKSGLVYALQYLIDTVAKGSNLIFTYDLDEMEEEVMSEKLKLAIYRIVQEQLTNILKYAKARNVHIGWYQRYPQFLLSITDDGVGFDPENKPEGIGLVNIETRASLFGGTLRVLSSPGKGCELSVSFYAGDK